MLYYLFDMLEQQYNLPGAGLFQFLSFRALVTVFFSILIATVIGKRIIYFIQKLQIGETVRDLGLEGQMQKKGTPTMGGVIIIIATLIPVLLFAQVLNVYILLLIVSLLWMGAIGFADDYIKVFKKDKNGLKGRFKVFGQIGLGVIVGATLYFNENVVVTNFDTNVTGENIREVIAQKKYHDEKSMKTTVPFLKHNEFDYATILSFNDGRFSWIIYILVVTFIITAVSNGANITDGLDGLAAGTSAIILITLALFIYISGNILAADYLNVMFIPNSGEALIFCMALVGACIGFLWFNAYPAQVFMGDTGSLSLGAAIAVLALIVRKELLIPLLCGVFLIENLSVMLQVGYFKYTRKKYGEGRRIFKMSPLHHHYQKSNIPEPKIVFRFWIIGIFLAILTLATLKVR